MNKTIWIMVLALILCCTGAIAVQTLNSASGYVVLPDASIAEKNLQLSATYVATEGTSELQKAQLAFACHGRGPSIRAIGGLSDRAEAGIGWLNVDKNTGDANAFTAAGKIRLLDRPESGVTLSGGAMFRGWSTDMSIEISDGDVEADLPNVTSLYLVLDKAFGAQDENSTAWTGSIGLMYDRFSSARLEGPVPFFAEVPGIPIEADGTIASESFVRPFLGVKAVNRGWTFLGEYKPQLKKGDFRYQSSTWSLAARREIKSGLTATAGLTNFNIPYTDADTGWFVDISYMLPR